MYKLVAFSRSPIDTKVEFEIDCSRDIRQGRSKNQMVSAETLNDQGWKHLAYSTEGDFILAAGDSYLGNSIFFGRK